MDEEEKEKAKVKWIIQKALSHKGLWLTSEEKAKEYFRQAELLRKAIRDLMDGLQRTYELTEVEAINIINGCYISDYVSKYRKLKEIADKEKRKKRKTKWKLVYHKKK